MARILVVDDHKTTADSIAQIGQRLGHEVSVFYDGTEALAAVEQQPYDVVVTDLRLPGASGMDILSRGMTIHPEGVVMVITAYGSIEKAVEAMRKGAFDFISKPFTIDEIKVKLEKALGQASVQQEMVRMRASLAALHDDETRRYNFNEIVGKSAAMQKVFDTIRKVAASDASVLILGESGTGKELVARAIHYNSQRTDGPFIRAHCAAYAEGVLESELFGHEKGSFTGAVARKIGRFEQAHGGTLFLDEIGDISHNVQVKLLRFLQEKEFERVGGTQTISVDVRILSATNQDLKELIGKRTFREDLYYRLNVISLFLPPLRERSDDIAMLVEHFLRQYAGREPVKKLDPEAMILLTKYHWPGNIRELQNVIERATVLAQGDRITVDHLPQDITGAIATAPRLTGPINFDAEIEKYEKELIQGALIESDYVKARAATLLGIDRNRLRYKMEKYGIEDLAPTK
ncbi:MAG: sigma-54-dependent Fis family transcriptional regulator [Myxococcales bacterium]|nr:sigma-54-dependent Fis family transcriptional regulator [Myxococcales bacterium]